jgi:hypothetical protein
MQAAAPLLLNCTAERAGRLVFDCGENTADTLLAFANATASLPALMPIFAEKPTGWIYLCQTK